MKRPSPREAVLPEWDQLWIGSTRANRLAHAPGSSGRSSRAAIVGDLRERPSIREPGARTPWFETAAKSYSEGSTNTPGVTVQDGQIVSPSGPRSVAASPEIRCASKDRSSSQPRADRQNWHRSGDVESECLQQEWNFFLGCRVPTNRMYGRSTGDSAEAIGQREHIFAVRGVKTGSGGPRAPRRGPDRGTGAPRSTRSAATPR